MKLMRCLPFLAVTTVLSVFTSVAEGNRTDRGSFIGEHSTRLGARSDVPHAMIRHNKPYDPRRLPREGYAIPSNSKLNANDLSSPDSLVWQVWSARYAAVDSNTEIIDGWTVGLDSTGNIFVISVWDFGFDIIKYNPSGAQVLQTSHRISGDTARFFAGLEWTDARVDRSGNAYVGCQIYYTDPEFSEMVVLKFNSSGSKQWENRYSRNDGFPAEPHLAIDKNGNCYVAFVFETGSLSSGLANIGTLKYDAAGIQQWIAEFNGASNWYDYPISVVVDDSGNAYVAGETYNPPLSSENGVLVKYNPAGLQQWMAYTRDMVRDVALDATGNVLITCSGNEQGETRKYSPSGALLWRKPGRGLKLAIDHANNIIVGSIRTTAPFTGIVKLNGGTGDSLWGLYYGDNYCGGSPRLAIDASNNVVFALNGCSPDTLRKVSAGGTQNWAQHYPGYHVNSIAIDDGGNVIVTGGTTMKYSAFGDSLWASASTKTFTLVSDDEPVFMVADPEGNVYVTSASGDFTIIKYDPSGGMAWKGNYHPPNSSAYPTAMAIDSSGNVYVCGYGWLGGYGGMDFLTVKYNTSGDTIWTRSYDGGVCTYCADYPTAIAADNGGNVYVTGYSDQDYYSMRDIVTVKYNPSGDSLWTRRYDGGSTYDYPTAIGLGDDGDVYVTGYSSTDRSNIDSSNFVTIKYSAGGDSLWAHTYDGPTNAEDRAMDIAVDEAGNAYVTGHSKGSGTYYDYATIKYDDAGTQKWLARYNGADNGNDLAAALKVDQNGNVYVTGRTYTRNEHHDFGTVKYDSNGTQRWVERYNGPTNYYDEARKMALDENGNIYVAGISYGVGTGLDYATVKYTPSGAEAWHIRHSGSGQRDDWLAALALDTAGNIFVTGYETGAFSMDMGDYDRDIVTIKYSQQGGFNSPVVGVEQPSIVREFALGQNYPNPFNPTTTLRFDLPKQSQVTLRVYNILGQLVKVLAEGMIYAAGRYQESFDASALSTGVYFYRLKATSTNDPTKTFTQVRKMLLIR